MFLASYFFILYYGESQEPAARSLNTSYVVELGWCCGTGRNQEATYKFSPQKVVNSVCNSINKFSSSSCAQIIVSLASYPSLMEDSSQFYIQTHLDDTIIVGTLR